MAKTTRWQFQYVGSGPVTSGFTDIVRKGKTVHTDGGLEPGDLVVVDTPDLRDWLRSNTAFLETDSPTAKKPTHKRAPRKRAPAKPKAG